ncbi:S9 family peptidase [Chiayiivirga flava]|uniref:Dipeptidyl aminopeptidase/acylaminoacyl peptidase n=1 Tax=Chiayiivirga flava TaxID=659595 RepID=A0A7W8G039_9GAMM|nr:prolyl oligopeptidase family serine peptidase [Chiayiivirga flava]MBB5209107.1 dipeptidyl aminopeptidase/acylaminoacyl peptidase [Chiayiivirga flava]
MRTLLIAATLLASTVALAQPLAVGTPEVKREVVGNRTAENIPPIPPQITQRLAQYQATRGASFAGWLRDGSMLVTTRFAETNQAHRVRTPLGMREQLTFFAEPVTQVASAPAKGGNGFVFAQDVGGSEFWQLHWYDLDSRSVTLLSDGGTSRNERPLFSHDGKQIAYSSTARNGVDTDIWVRDIATGKARAVVTEGGAWYAADFSHDGTRLLVLKYVSINESYPGEVDVATGKLRLFPVDGGKAAFTTFRYARDGSVFYVSDEGTQFRTLRHHDPKGGAPRQISADVPWDVTDVALSDDGTLLAFASNEDGIGKLHVRRLPGLEPLTLPTLPVGVLGNVGFSPDSTRLAVTINGATSPSDVYVISLADAALERWTQSEVGGLDATRFIAPTLVRYPTFDRVDGKPRTIPAFYYRPPGDGPFPVVVQIHGGPEAQALPAFNPGIQYLLNEQKIAVLVPNVRGSAGYGKDYLLLDNGDKREDSVKDIGALLDWIATRPELDADRVGVYGGSYGGYMVLASMTHYNDRLRAGIDVVGISSFNTFLANTQGYRRDLRRAEYGDERDPAMRAFHETIAPLNNAQKITKPLFVAQGANDPRVPASEAEQIVSKVRGNGGDVWYLLFGDEGHGFAKKTNADYFGAAQMLFWQKHLLDEE